MPNTFVFDITPQLNNIITEVDANEAKLDLIRGTDVPAIVTEIDANETKLDAIIALIPQIVRGTFTSAFLSHDTSSWADVLNISDSQGKLYFIIVSTSATVTSADIRISLDSQTATPHTLLLYNTRLCIYPGLAGTAIFYLQEDDSNLHYFNLEFSSNFRVEVRVTAGPGSIDTRVIYALDDF